MKKRLICMTLLLAVLCTVFSSCAGSLTPLTTEKEEVSEVKTEETKISYPCETDPDFCKEWDYAYLSASALDSLPVAKDGMTAMEKRKLCLDYFQMQLTFRWQTNLDVTDYVSTYAKTVKDRSLLTANLYAGIPYQSGGNGNLYRWLEYYDEKTGVFDVQRAFAENGGYGEDGDIEDVKRDGAGNITYKRYRSMKTFFNACSSGANWAWGRVINSADFGATMDYNVNGGFIPVGCYTYSNMQTIDKFGTVTEGNPSGLDVDDVIAEMGERTLYDCYALMRPADCVVSPGHVMMVKKVKLIRRADGTPDPMRSTVITLEQIENWGARTELNGRELYRQGGVDRVYTFEELYKSGYIPFTFAELLDENDPFDKPHLDFYKRYIANRNIWSVKYKAFGFSEKALAEMTGTGVEEAKIFLSEDPESLEELALCYVGSNYSISDVFVRVKAPDGAVVLENVYRSTSASTRCIGMSSQMSNAPTGEDGKRPSLMTGVAEALTGENRLEIAVRLSTGQLLLIENLNV